MRFPSLRLASTILLLGLISSNLKPLKAAAEDSLLILRQGGRVAGITPQIGGRIVLYRLEVGKNVLAEQPGRWNDPPLADLLSRDLTLYDGTSVWAGPQADWWSNREPYPPKPETIGQPIAHWPPDPAWDRAAFTITEKSTTRVILQSPVSKLTGLQLTKSVELLPDGRLVLKVTATNRGDRIVTRDLWLLTQVPATARCFLPLKAEEPKANFAKAISSKKIDALTTLELNPGFTTKDFWSTKMCGHPNAGWMASATVDTFFVIRHPMVNPSSIAPGHSPVEVCYVMPPYALCELEYHDAIKALKPGESMQSESTWEILPNPGCRDTDSQARFLRFKLNP